MKKTTKNNSEKSFEFGQVMTMLEQMNDGIAVIAEAHDETNTRLGNLEKKVDVIDERMIRVESDVTVMNERMIRVESDVTVMNERMIRIEDDVIEIKHKLSEKVDRDEFNKMEKRMVKLEKLVFAKLG